MTSYPLRRKSERDPISEVFPRRTLRDVASAIAFGLPRSSRSSTLAAVRSAAARQSEAPSRTVLAAANLSIATSAWRTAYEQGQKTWVEVALTFKEFSAHAQALCHREAPAHAVDLYLAAACRLGRPAAVQVLDQAYIQRTRSAIHGVVRSASIVEDVLQDLRCRLLVGPAAKIGSYQGRGPLGSWIRAIALNVAKDYLRSETARRRADDVQVQGRALPVSSGADAASLPIDDPTRCILRQGRVQACLDAIQQGFQSLPPLERRLLHDYYIGGQSIDALAPLYQVNRATVARRLNRSTDEVGRQARKRLARLYPRESSGSLNALALAACRDLIVNTATLLVVPISPDAPRSV